MSSHHTPLQVVELALGGIERIGPVLGLSAKSPYGWRHASAIRAPGDLPSFIVARRLLAHFAELGIPITAEHLVHGADEAELERIGLIQKVAAE